ncbi:hypothetical protein [Mesorhizobium sp. M0809]|uniref:hypothetical protein n=1 Tax=Mesorhizobium sp. M0809 TaxID=2957003 RepID=UPI00333A6728
MLCGKGVITTWNGITEEGRIDFYQWHLHEHMPERTGIPGFLRGRRYRAADGDTKPEYFTLYEVEEFEVLKSAEYIERLNSPTDWTKRATAHFRSTSRGLGRVLDSQGPGMGGALATLRFLSSGGAEQEVVQELSALTAEVMRLPLVCGVHLCKADNEATQVRTAESQGRTDYDAPPTWVILIEGCMTYYLKGPVAKVLEHPRVQEPRVGQYLLEYVRMKTEMAAG